MDASATTTLVFGGVTPVLRVSNAGASRDYHVKVLGFKVDFDMGFFVSASRGRCCLFLSEGNQGHPESWVWIDGKDVDALYEEYKASGAKIRHPPTNYSWALEMQVEDLDRNILRLGSDPRARASRMESGSICTAAMDQGQAGGSGVSVAALTDEEVEVGGHGLRLELPHHEGNLAAMVGGVVSQMLHEVGKAELASARLEHLLQVSVGQAAHEINLILLDFWPF